MITVIDNSETLIGKKVRELLLKSGFPCALCDSSKFVNSKDAVVAFNKYDYGDSADEELVIAADGSALKNDVRRRAELFRIVERCAELLSVKYGVNTETFNIGRLSVKGQIAYVRGNVIQLTHSEMLILRYLAFYSDRWSRISDIAHHCTYSNSAKAVPVHIFNINQKVSFYTQCSLIEARRKVGYKIIF